MKALGKFLYSLLLLCLAVLVVVGIPLAMMLVVPLLTTFAIWLSGS